MTTIHLNNVMSDQPLPPPLPAKIPVRIFDWKPYARALVWMVTAAVFISFATIILVPRLKAIVEDSGLFVNERIGAIIAFATNGGSWILSLASIGLCCIGILSEAVCKGTWSRRVRSWGCGAISYCTIIATILLSLSHAVIVGVFAPVTAANLDSYRDFSAQIGVLDAIEKQNAIVRTDGADRARSSIGVDELDSLDDEERIAILERATVMVAHASNPVIRRQALSQAVVAYRSLDREYFEADMEGYLKVPELLAAAAGLTGESFESPDELLVWHQGLRDDPQWQIPPIRILEED